MLVLTRKAQQTIRVGENITITILRVKGQSVRVGIEAPRDIHVVRGELPPKPNQAADSPVEENVTVEVTTVPAVKTKTVRKPRGIDVGKRPHARKNTHAPCDPTQSTSDMPQRGLQTQVSARRVRAVSRLNGEPIDALQRQTLPPLRSTLGLR